ncbi:MAG TPA: 2-dehydropantoate 2-reductase [Candidatus Limnocylindria bacterium]|nr:2-dehydropantoate 2-reductase [Candidatus Limnocylindria bacterium]
MRVAILGMGAIGHVVARALDGRAQLVKVDRTTAPLREGEAPVDAAIVTTKTPGTAWAAEIAARILAPDGVALTIQNGLGNHETLAEHVGNERAAVGVIYVGAEMVNGELRATGAGKVELGRPASTKSREKLDDLGRLFREGGMDVTVVDDAWPAVWRKVVTNAAVNPLTALIRSTNAELLANAPASLVADCLAREVARVATASGVRIAEDEATKQWRAMAALTGANRSSMLQDVEAGRPTEIEAISGAVAREGERRGVAAPLNQAITLLVASLVRA